MADVEEVEVVVAHSERATLRVGDVFLKIDADQTRTDVEVEAMAIAPIPTPEVLWRKPPVLALAALPGTAVRCRHGPVGASTTRTVHRRVVRRGDLGETHAQNNVCPTCPTIYGRIDPPRRVG